MLAEFGLGKHLARVQHHVAQQAEFDAAERARDAIADYRLAVFVEAQSGAAQDWQDLSVAATNQGLQASHQYAHGNSRGSMRKDRKSKEPPGRVAGAICCKTATGT